MINNYFIILASGQSKRFNSKKPKQFITYKNKALFEHSLDKAIKLNLFKKIILVVNDKKQIKKKYPKETLAIFVQPPSISELESRLRKRGTDNEEKIKERIAKARTELEYAPQFDYCLINEDLDQAKKEVVQVVSDFLNS